jgi:hypothetical protein
MNGSMRLIIFALAFFVSSFQLASSADLIRETIDAAKAECEAMDNGEFSTTEQTIQLADITGDGRPEEIVDAGQFACSTSASLYCRTGGCEISVFVDGKKHGFFGHGWKVGRTAHPADPAARYQLWQLWRDSMRRCLYVERRFFLFSQN